ncbi:leucine-rich repeat-containing protein 61 isoform X2 [Narcine bancroftii]|uniref:leucine-rich repeat-containing protein 61 isoform X2 n=1 Tax=Narcine bancroftii TaxID=1343680 RepID=UPI0038319246
MEPKPRVEDETVKISVKLLKLISGEFDLESILFLKLTKMGICSLGCIDDCVNLERLDLSRNDISNLKPLASLRLLTVLNLSANRISNLDPLHACENLQSLNLAGNLISSFDALHSITDLKNLDTMRLKDTICSFSNPVCMNTSYLNTMLDMFPNIKVLDGERVSGRGSDLYQLCKNIDASLKEIDGSVPIHAPLVPKKWVEDGYWELKPMQQTQTDEAIEQFHGLVKECRELNSKAADVITKIRRTLRAAN